VPKSGETVLKEAQLLFRREMNDLEQIAIETGDRMKARYGEARRGEAGVAKGADCEARHPAFSSTSKQPCESRSLYPAGSQKVAVSEDRA